MVSEVEVRLPIQPRGDLVLVLVDSREEITATGLYLPQTNEYMRTGVVRAVGPGKEVSGSSGPYRMSMDLKVGDRVYLAEQRYKFETKNDDGTWVVVPEGMIAGVLP